MQRGRKKSRDILGGEQGRGFGTPVIVSGTKMSCLDKVRLIPIDTLFCGVANINRGLIITLLTCLDKYISSKLFLLLSGAA